MAHAQTTTSTGSISGVVSDPTGAAVPNAKVTIIGAATGQAINITTPSSGTYNSGALIPGEYRVRVEAPGFQTSETAVTVQVGSTTTTNVALQIGRSTEVVQVEATAVGVNTEQASVQGVLTAQQIDNLPINGRNFLDLAQLEPGVQIQDGTNFDPTKVGYSSISFGGRFGRTARISVDGLDVSDETVGTTTQDIPSSGIQEFQISQSTLDLSNDLTSSGAVNVITRSGGNAYHGELFYYIRDWRFGAQLPHPPGLDATYQRNQFGGRLGGYILKDRLFFFMDYERTKQDSFVPVQYPSPFQAFSGGFGSPFRENEPMGRLDWQATKNLRLFYRFNYYDTLAVATFFSSSLQPYKNKNYARTHVAGADFTTGQWTHSIRVQRLKFENGIADAVLGSGLPLANLGLFLNVSNGPQTGPNYLAPQATLQLDKQIKYDGGRTLGKHFLRFGLDYNNITGGGFAGFFSIAPYVDTNGSPTDAALAATGPYPGGAGNPLNYPVELVLLGNGQGYGTENPGLGYPAGRQGPDNRLAFYIGDTWKVTRNFTLNYGVRYLRDTGRTDSDLPPVPALSALIPGLGNRVTQPNKSLAPQVGIAWDPTGKAKTVIRAGAGLFYENVIWNNVLFDRPQRLQKGAFLAVPAACFSGTSLPISVSSGTISIPQQLCNETVGQAAAGIAAFEAQYEASVKFDLNAPNPNYIGTELSQGLNLPTSQASVFYPNFKTPRSLQMNVGVQHEFRRGTVLTVDYLRNVTTHTLLGVDANHVGDIRYFNKNAAQAAIAATLSQCGVSSVSAALAGPCPGGSLRGNTLSMTDFAGNGLTSPGLDFGGVCPFNYGCAFPGINPAAPELLMLYPLGRSVYNGLDVKLTHQVTAPMRGVKNVNFQIAYSLSRFVNAGGGATGSGSVAANADQDFVINAVDYRNPLGYSGPSLLDRKHQLSFGGFADFPFGFRGSVIGHFYSGLPVTLVVPNTNIGPGEIFRTDFTGDGTVEDLLPGTKTGAFNRGISGPTQLNQAIGGYNNSIANQPTPAGNVLVQSGLFTVAQLQQLGGVAPTIQPAPPGEVGVAPLRACDMKLSWVHKFAERFEVEPSAGFYNVFNFANWDLPPNVINGLLNGSPGSVNGTTQPDRITNRVGAGTGVFTLGAPRMIEFGLRVSF